MKTKHLSTIDATPPATKRQSVLLVFKNTRLPQYPAFMLLRFVHATFPNDKAVNYVEMVRTGLRMPKDRFDLYVADGTFVPAPTTAVLLGRVKPSTKFEIMHSETYESPRMVDMHRYLEAA